MAPPTTMKGIQIPTNGGVEVLKLVSDLAVPTLEPDSILVRNEYAGVNFIDTYFRTGLYKAPSLPLTLGREGAGVVEASTSSQFAPGDRVTYMYPAGAYAQYSAVPASQALRLPDGLSTQLAAASLLQGLTAWTFIREAGAVQKGQWVLVHAAAGGVGTQLVQMLKAVGARVIGTAGSEEKCALARKLGAEYVIQSRGEDIVKRVMEITGGHGADVIFDGIGKATFDLDLEMVAMKGTVVVFGNASGPVAPVDILRLGGRNTKIVRPVVNGYVATREDLEKYSGELFDMLVSGAVKIGIYKTYPLEDVAQAHTDLESRKTTGKLVLKID